MIGEGNGGSFCPFLFSTMPIKGQIIIDWSCVLVSGIMVVVV